jgi:hypothetical protein
MRSSKLLTLLAIGLSLGIAACGAMEAARAEQAQKQQVFEDRVDKAHIFVTTEAPAADKPYKELGDLTYTEPFTPDAIDEAKIGDKLKAMALAKWPDTIDAIVDENQATSTDGSQITVTAKAIAYDSSVDRDKLRHMQDSLTVSPNGN